MSFRRSSEPNGEARYLNNFLSYLYDMRKIATYPLWVDMEVEVCEI